MENKLMKLLVALGVPGVSLGVFYLLLRGFDFQFSKVDAQMTAYIVILFLLLVGGVTLYALSRYRNLSHIGFPMHQEVAPSDKKVSGGVIIGGRLSSKNLELAKDLFLTSFRVTPDVPHIGDTIVFNCELKNTGDKKIIISQANIGSRGWSSGLTNIEIAPFSSVGIGTQINVPARNAEKLLSGNPHHFQLSIKSPHLPDIEIEDVAIISVSL